MQRWIAAARSELSWANACDVVKAMEPAAGRHTSARFAVRICGLLVSIDRSMNQVHTHLADLPVAISLSRSAAIVLTSRIVHRVLGSSCDHSGRHGTKTPTPIGRPTDPFNIEANSPRTMLGLRAN